MNKETRSFIWGILVLLICALGIAVEVNKIMDGTFHTWLDWLVIILDPLAVISAGSRIYKAIN